MRERLVTSHVAQNISGRRLAIDRRTTGHGSYARGQRARKVIEEAFGYIKTIAGQARTELRSNLRPSSEPVQDHPRRPTAPAGQFFNDLLELRERIPDPVAAPAY
jgi:hypothetical protein